MLLETLSRRTVWGTALLEVHWASRICGLIIFIKFGKYFCKYFSCAPSLQGTPVAYIPGYLELSHSSGMLCLPVENYVIFILRLDSYCCCVPRSDTLSSAMSNLILIPSSGFSAEAMLFSSPKVQFQSYVHLPYLFCNINGVQITIY